MNAPFEPKLASALLLVAHGSGVDPAPSGPLRELTQRLRASGLFGAVTCGFRMEAPGMREALDSLTLPEVFIVPIYTVEGYFVRKIIPHELGLAGPVTVRPDGQTLRLCRPVGGHPRMTDLLLHRAREAAPQVDFASADLLMLGHGTPLDERSSAAVDAQVAAVRSRGIFAGVHGAFMETAPGIADWLSFTSCLDVIAVPFFIADGPHSGEDIPRLLGIAAGQERKSPHCIGGRKLYYACAVGTDPGMFDIVLDQVSASSEGVWKSTSGVPTA